MVIADTSVWIPFFNQPQSAEKAEMDRLIDADAVALVGVVLAELIQGCRTTADANAIVSRLAALPFLETTFAVWQRAGELSLALRRRGMTVPLSDLVVAGLALDHGCAIYTLDNHFDRIPDLALHRVARRPRRQ